MALSPRHCASRSAGATLSSRSDTMAEKLRVAAVQMSSQDDVGENLARARDLVARAPDARRRARAPSGELRLSRTRRRQALPSPSRSATRPAVPFSQAIADAARRARVHVIAGGMPERAADPARPYNACVVVAPDGTIAGKYRKVHLFDVDVGDGQRYCESASTTPGDVRGDRRHRRILGGALGLLRPSLSGALPQARRRRVPTFWSSCRLHAGDGQGPLARAATRARHRITSLRRGRRAVGDASARPSHLRKESHRRPLGRCARAMSGRGGDRASPMSSARTSQQVRAKLARAAPPPLLSDLLGAVSLPILPPPAPASHRHGVKAGEN